MGDIVLKQCSLQSLATHASPKAKGACMQYQADPHHLAASIQRGKSL